jgi:ATPase subunit of ABC transporter with duplicated ATPase domains
VSHDRAFLSNVATDVIVLENTTLRYYPCGLAEYEEAAAQKAAHHAGLRDASARQEQHALEAAACMRQHASGRGRAVDDALLKQARQKEHKVDRIGSLRPHTLVT